MRNTGGRRPRTRDASTATAPRRAVNRAAARATPMFLTSVLALSGALDPFRLPLGSAPVRIGAVLLALALGIGLTVILDRPGPRPFWQMELGATLVLLPITSLQAYASRVPFVAISRGSAGPFLWLTVAAVVAL